MGCTSSTEIATASAKDVSPTTHQKHKKIITAGTEAMAISSSHRGVNTTTATATTTDNTPPTSTNTGNETTTKPSAAASVVVGNWNVRYACLSKRGRDPDDALKPNQDSYSVHERLANDAAFFGVYDGHGPHGEACSQFTNKRLPVLAKTYLEQNCCASTSIDQLQAAMLQAHTECNAELRSSNINDAYSGTTSITLYIHPADSRITVCNVGDSRAILGTTLKGALQAAPLSKDQTPHRSDEAARCRKAGARILSFGQVDPSSKDESDDDSEVEDPPRVWSQKGNFPGTAFTRSIGDAVAETLGVFAEPEMLTVKISSNEKVMVLASDGIFDVMSNQEVIDLCFAYKDDPTQACKAVIEKSHQEWLEMEECADEASANYDDMTVICIFLDDVRDEISSSSTDVQLPKPTPQPRQHHPKRARQKTLRNLEEMAEDQQ